MGAASWALGYLVIEYCGNMVLTSIFLGSDAGHHTRAFNTGSTYAYPANFIYFTKQCFVYRAFIKTYLLISK